VLGHFLHHVVELSEHELLATGAVQVTLAAISALAALAGIALARRIWARTVENPSVEPAILQRAWGIDDAVSAVVGGPGRELADAAAFTVDKKVVDGAFTGLGAVVRMGGGQLRRLQTGYVRNYALAVAGGTVLLLGYIALRVGG
jgi:NADH-quinone oxidoreductase subunit L